MNNLYFDRVVIGSGIYGLYAARELSKKGFSTLVLDIDTSPMARASLVNQARVHNGYHYPRSISTGLKAIQFFDRFCNDFGNSINGDFDKIYAIAKQYTWTNAGQFVKICSNMNIKCDEINRSKYFNSSLIEAAFITKEFSFDAKSISQTLYSNCNDHGCVFFFNSHIISVGVADEYFDIHLADGRKITTPWVLNATYAGVNQIHSLFSLNPLKIKYELCEVVLCDVDKRLDNLGLTVMDGPFFSLMPFGLSGFHSLTTVANTPHLTSKEVLPTFPCQASINKCSPTLCANCNSCEAAPVSAYPSMYKLAKKYLRNEFTINKISSMFALKAILNASEVDDSRPTLIKQLSSSPAFYTVFSGKVNAIYDLDDIL